MHASKESCRDTRNIVALLHQRFPNSRVVTGQLNAIGDFLDAAEKRLPSQAAIERDRQRRRARDTEGK